ncbi:ADP-ribosylation factor-like protein 13B [Ornithodoros turicata]|uniref:ADP-ribosylation factor-like protein 13B n=1 Tax=Ornithodoros turicata TaxID=34597 RepID=UPI00313A2567
MGVPLCTQQHRKEITLLIIGLDNAGKTTTTKHLLREDPDDVVPTVGFSRGEFQHSCCNVTVYDLGGGSRIRSIWKNYYSQVHGVVFCVDASAPERVQECGDVLAQVLQDPYISGKPLLVLFNKQDKEGAVDEGDLCAMLNLESIVNTHKCPTKVETCCAKHFANGRKRRDPGIERGFHWLLEHITTHYVQLGERVRGERERQAALDEEDRQQRLQRVQKAREERERAKGIINKDTIEHRDDSNGNVIEKEVLGSVPQEIRDHEAITDEGSVEDTNAVSTCRKTNTPDGARVILVSPAGTSKDEKRDNREASASSRRSCGIADSMGEHSGPRMPQVDL